MKTLTSERRDSEAREWWQGWWESTVCWLEVTDDESSEELVKTEKTFYSSEERNAFLEERVGAGYVFDILWSTETNLGGKGYPGAAKYEGEEWENMLTGRMVSEDQILVV